jgi:hypothetical protein
MLSAILLPASLAAATSMRAPLTTAENIDTMLAAPGGGGFLSAGRGVGWGNRGSIGVGQLLQQLQLTDGLGQHMSGPEGISLQGRQASSLFDQKNAFRYPGHFRRDGFQGRNGFDDTQIGAHDD